MAVVAGEQFPVKTAWGEPGRLDRQCLPQVGVGLGNLVRGSTDETA